MKLGFFTTSLFWIQDDQLRTVSSALVHLYFPNSPGAIVFIDVRMGFLHHDNYYSLGLDQGWWTCQYVRPNLT